MAPALFRLAPQSKGLLALTTIIFPIPLAMLVAAGALRWAPLAGPAIAMLAIWAFIWLWMRPRRFAVTDAGLRIEWPLRSELIPLDGIRSVERLDGATFRQRYGLGMRIGAGGLWGGFGLYKTASVTFRFYVSRLDDLVVIQTDGRPLMITPARPEALVQALRARLGG